MSSHQPTGTVADVMQKAGDSNTKSAFAHVDHFVRALWLRTRSNCEGALAGTAAQVQPRLTRPR